MLKAKLIEEEPFKINLNVNYTATKAEPAEGVLCLKGTVDTYESLPNENNTKGDVYLIGTQSPYDEYLWTGDGWEALAPKREPLPDFVEREEFNRATESLKSELKGEIPDVSGLAEKTELASLKSELTGELSKVSELAPKTELESLKTGLEVLAAKSEVESLKSDLEAKLAGVSDLVSKLQENGGGEGGSSEIDFGIGLSPKGVGSALMGIVSYLTTLHNSLTEIAAAQVRRAGDKVTLPIYRVDLDPHKVMGGGYDQNQYIPPITLIKTEKGFRMEAFISVHIPDASKLGTLKDYKEGRQWYDFHLETPDQFVDLSYKLPFPEYLYWNFNPVKRYDAPSDDSEKAKNISFVYQKGGYSLIPLWDGEEKPSGSLSVNGKAYTEWEVDNA